MKRCKVCKGKFTPTFSTLQATCTNPTCVIKWSKVQQEKEWQKRKDRMKVENMSSDKYRADVIQPIVNEIARLIDYGQPCIASGRYTGKMAGGHFVSVGSNRSCSLNLHNIHIQSFESNSFKSGDESKYRLGLIQTYGQSYFDFVDSLRQLKGIDIGKDKLIELKPLMSEIRNNLKRNTIKRSPEERIKLREEINIKIGIYNEYSYCKKAKCVI